MLCKMIDRYGYPKELLVAEQSLNKIATAPSRIPKRRIDLLCYTKNSSSDGLHPLLLVECKAVEITETMVKQVVGYNAYVLAPFIALVSPQEERLGWLDPAERSYRFSQGLPTYNQLLASLEHA